jgi:hypothetical protein
MGTGGNGAVSTIFFIGWTASISFFAAGLLVISIFVAGVS